MAKKELPYRHRLTALFISFAILLTGTGSLTRTMSLDYYSVLNTLLKIIPSCIIMGILGWVMGMILDQPRRRSKINYGNLFVNEIMKSTPAESSTAEDAVTEGI